VATDNKDTYFESHYGVEKLYKRNEATTREPTDQLPEADTGREPTDQEILDILAEECAEVIHIVSKIRRFGMNNIHPKSDRVTNKGRLRAEILDVMSMIEWVQLRDIMPPFFVDEIRNATKLKHDKVRKYLRD